MDIEVASEEACTEFFRNRRWSEGVYCIYCRSSDTVRNGVREDGIRQYRCKECGKAWNDRSDTVLEKTDMSVKECLFIFKALESGFSVNRISEELERSWQTINKFKQLVLISMESREFRELSSKLTKVRDDKNPDYSKFGCY